MPSSRREKRASQGIARPPRSKTNVADDAPTGAVGAPDALDDQLRALLHAMIWTRDAPGPAILRLGQPALERLLDAPDAVFWATEMDWRDYGGNRREAIAAFARRDLNRVLSAMRTRHWTDARIALSGIGLVQDARVVPFLLRAYADAAPATRAEAIRYLGFQRASGATSTVLRALRDRSSSVRLAAIRALGDIGDPNTTQALEVMAQRNPPSKLVVHELKRALEKIRPASPTP
jgi:HEAT repeat protein